MQQKRVINDKISKNIRTNKMVKIVNYINKIYGLKI
jgi:hypothetical protein